MKRTTPMTRRYKRRKVEDSGGAENVPPPSSICHAGGDDTVQNDGRAHDGILDQRNPPARAEPHHASASRISIEHVVEAVESNHDSSEEIPSPNKNQFSKKLIESSKLADEGKEDEDDNEEGKLQRQYDEAWARAQAELAADKDNKNMDKLHYGTEAWKLAHATFGNDIERTQQELEDCMHNVLQGIVVPLFHTRRDAVHKLGADILQRMQANQRYRSHVAKQLDSAKAMLMREDALADADDNDKLTDVELSLLLDHFDCLPDGIADNQVWAQLVTFAPMRAHVTRFARQLYALQTAEVAMEDALQASSDRLMACVQELMLVATHVEESVHTEMRHVTVSVQAAMMGNLQRRKDYQVALDQKAQKAHNMFARLMQNLQNCLPTTSNKKKP